MFSISESSPALSLVTPAHLPDLHLDPTATLRFVQSMARLTSSRLEEKGLGSYHEAGERCEDMGVGGVGMVLVGRQVGHGTILIGRRSSPDLDTRRC